MSNYSHHHSPLFFLHSFSTLFDRHTLFPLCQKMQNKMREKTDDNRTKTLSNDSTGAQLSHVIKLDYRFPALTLAI